MAEAEKAASPFNIYISSSTARADESLLDELLKQLSMLRRQPGLFVWEKRLIPPGADREQAIVDAINRAHLILFLISSDFLDSEQCYQEMVKAMERKDEQGITIIPLLLRSTAGWQETPIGELEPLPSDLKFINAHPNRGPVLRDIVERLQRVIKDIRAARSPVDEQPPRSPTEAESMRSNISNSDRARTFTLLQAKIAAQDFDVFLCYNAQDRPAVKQIGEQLKQHGILPWLDEWELRPGLPWQRILEQQITQIKTAAVFVGKSGLGPWQHLELEAFLREFVRHRNPVIPVLLPNVPQQPELPIFLRGMTWIDFNNHEPDPLQQLIWGITNKRDAS